MPESIKELINAVANPVSFTVFSWAILFFAIVGYKIWTKPAIAMSIFVIMVLIFALSMGDYNFRLIITKPDNIPIATMIFLIYFFVWISFRQAAINDERMEKGGLPMEAEEKDDRVLVWPDLVFIEFLCAIIATIVLVIWSILIPAPLEDPANPTRTPNPSKAPWYFLGLQEMLVYFDPWLAGVVLPSMIISGLIIIPYCDVSPKGSGYYTLKERKFAISIYLFGFVSLWAAMIVMGTFLRGPNWNFFGPYEKWDVHKVLVLNNVNLSEYFWVKTLGTGLPGSIIMRELPGILFLLGYFALFPAIMLAFRFFRDYYKNAGIIRYSLIMVHFSVMMLMVVKMLGRWAFNLKYIVYIPEYFFNV